MSVYKKLQEARIKLLNSKLSKSGKNKFAGFEYFELADFLPTVQKIFSETGLGSSITFSSDIAVLTIVDVENASDRIEFHSPVVVPTMKGCNEIQALGAAQTYLRRYLYVNALEIVEHDAIDAVAGKGEVKGVVHKPTNNPDFNPDEEELKHLQGILDTILSLDKDYEAIKAFMVTQNMDADEKTWVWDKLDSSTRSGIKAVK